MSRVSHAAVIMITLVLATSCSENVRSPHTLRVPTNITRIDVQAPDGRVLKRIDSSGAIQRVISFLLSRRKQWRYTDMGFPTPPLELLFYRGDQRLGRFGAGRYRADCRDPTPGYFESDLPRDGQLPLYDIGASEDDLHAFLALIGMPEYSLDTNDC